MEEEIRKAVRAALDIAVDENGYIELVVMEPEEVEADLRDNDMEFEIFEEGDLLEYVKEWQTERRKTI